MESIGRGVLRTRLVPASQLNAHHLSKIRFSMELRLVNLVESGRLTNPLCWELSSTTTDSGPTYDFQRIGTTRELPQRIRHSSNL